VRTPTKDGIHYYPPANFVHTQARTRRHVRTPHHTTHPTPTDISSRARTHARTARRGGKGQRETRRDRKPHLAPRPSTPRVLTTRRVRTLPPFAWVR